MSITDSLIGRPLATSKERGEHIGVAAGIPIFGLDGLTSAAYGPEAAMTLLIPLGLLGTHYIVPILSAILILLTIMYFSYRQTIAAYPGGGGSYTVAEQRPAPAKPKPFSTTQESELLAYGVPQEWLSDVREATEDSLLELLNHLPAEAAEALLNLAVGAKPARAETAPQGANPFAHPDALRRFRVMRNVEELALALDYPSEKWAGFLHPAQRQLVEKQYAGPAKVAGSAVFVRSAVQISRATAAAENATLPFVVLDEQVSIRPNRLSIGTMHLAKGLEFRCVAVMACDDGVLPQQERLAQVSDVSDLEDVYNTERHLPYVACTRARDHLLVSGISPVSEFLEDMM
jgi:hypothetical protein